MPNHAYGKPIMWARLDRPGACACNATISAICLLVPLPYPCPPPRRRAEEVFAEMLRTEHSGAIQLLHRPGLELRRAGNYQTTPKNREILSWLKGQGAVSGF